MKKYPLVCLLLLTCSAIHAQEKTPPVPATDSVSGSASEAPAKDPLAGPTLSLDTMVVAASRVQESLLHTPITVEKMDSGMVRDTPSLSFYDGLANLKGVEMVTSGLTYNQINTRGFDDTGNARFLQLVDGVDNQTPGLTFAVGNLFGVSDIDVESVEVIPGAASALYGPVAFNGLLSINTKDPFTYPGLSIQTKFGVNHIGEADTNPKGLYDVSLRYALVVNDRLAFKFNFSRFSGTDWYATNYTDVNLPTPAAQRGPNDPAYNGLNIYGDESARTIPGVGSVSRTGYEERYLLDYADRSLKTSAAVHYRVTKDVTAIYQYNYGEGTAAYTGSNRFSLDDFKLQQH